MRLSPAAGTYANIFDGLEVSDSSPNPETHGRVRCHGEHEKVLVNCEAEFDQFIDRMGLLGEELGPLVLQFRWFNRYEIQADEFFRRLRFFLQVPTLIGN